MREKDRLVVGWLRFLAWFLLLCEGITGISLGVKIANYKYGFILNKGEIFVYVASGILVGLCTWAIFYGFASIVDNVSILRWGKDVDEEADSKTPETPEKPATIY